MEGMTATPSAFMVPVSNDADSLDVILAQWMPSGIGAHQFNASCGGMTRIHLLGVSPDFPAFLDESFESSPW
jgi:hypothetical protein